LSVVVIEANGEAGVEASSDDNLLSGGGKRVARLCRLKMAETPEAEGMCH
jgi:hypothetical protein